MDTKTYLNEAVDLTRRARALNDAFDGKAMPVHVGKQIETMLNTAAELRKAAKDAEPVYRRPMTEVKDGGIGIDGRSYGTGPTLAKQDRLTKDQSVADWMVSKGMANPYDVANLDLGRWLKGVATGDWHNAEAEQEITIKALGEGTIGAGGATVPTPLMAKIIDLVRAKSVVFQAGAQTVPMSSSTLKIPRLLTEGSPGWRNENAVISDQDMTFDQVTFTARSLNRLIKVSVELFEDGDPGAGEIISHSFAGQIAAEIDRAALRGSGVAPEPRGILNTAGITTTTHGANGTALTNFDFLLDAAGAIRAAGIEPNAHVVAARTRTNLGKLKEATTNAYLRPPADLLPVAVDRNIPINLTVGTSNDCSEIYTAAWGALLVGMRTQLRLEVLRERYADNGQMGFLAWFRGDVQLSQPAAFVVDTGVRG